MKIILELMTVAKNFFNLKVPCNLVIFRLFVIGVFLTANIFVKVILNNLFSVNWNYFTNFGKK